MASAAIVSGLISNATVRFASSFTGGSRNAAFKVAAGIDGLSRQGRKRQMFAIKASTDLSDAQTKAAELFESAKQKWDGIDDKPTFLLYSGASVLGILVSSAVLSAIDSVPLLPGLMKLIGTLFTGWFAYRYLISKSGRADLAVEVEDLKAKIAGAKKVTPPASFIDVTPPE